MDGLAKVRRNALLAAGAVAAVLSSVSIWLWLFLESREREFLRPENKTEIALGVPVAALAVGLLMAIVVAAAVFWACLALGKARDLLEANLTLAEEKLAEERFRLAVESAPLAMLMVDESGAIVVANAETERLFGYTRAELLGMDIAMLVPPAIRPSHSQKIRNFFADFKPLEFPGTLDIHAIRKGGEPFPVEIRLSPIRTRQGPLAITSIVDISARKQAEVRLRLAVEASPSAMVMVDQAGKIVLVNSETERLFGYTRGELLGAAVELLVPDALRADHPGHRREFQANPTTRPMGAGRDLFGRHKNGTLIPVEIGLNPIRTAEGFLVLSSIVDISQRKKDEERIRRLNSELEGRVADRTRDLLAANASLAAEVKQRTEVEAALRMSEGLLRQAVLRAPVPIMIFAEDGEVRMLSGVWTVLSGYTLEDIPTFQVWASRALGYQESFASSAVLTDSGKHSLFPEGEIRVRTKDGRTLVWDCSSAIIGRLLDGRRLVKTVAQDVTERKQIEARLQLATEELRRSNEDLEQFAYVASHDLRAPLRAISNLSGWITEDLEDQAPLETRNHLRLLQQRVLRMDRMIVDLLDYSRAGRVVGSVEIVHVEKLIQEVVDLLNPGPAFSIVIGEGMPILKTPPGPLRQVFSNLIGNAIKHHHKGRGRIEIGVQKTDGRFAFSVADDGPGIAPEFHERIFQLFQVLQSRDRVEGSGIGLSIAKRIVESQGGRLTIASRPGQGSVFRFTWPEQFDPKHSAIRAAIVERLQGGPAQALLGGAETGGPPRTAAVASSPKQAGGESRERPLPSTS